MSDKSVDNEVKEDNVEEAQPKGVFIEIVDTPNGEVFVPRAIGISEREIPFIMSASLRDLWKNNNLPVPQ